MMLESPPPQAMQRYATLCFSAKSQKATHDT